jgi:hypothetical protein
MQPEIELSSRAIEAEINHHIERVGYKIVEVPIQYRKRLGKKKLGFRDGLKILRRIIIERLADSLDGTNLFNLF